MRGYESLLINMGFHFPSEFGRKYRIQMMKVNSISISYWVPSTNSIFDLIRLCDFYRGNFDHFWLNSTSLTLKAKIFNNITNFPPINYVSNSRYQQDRTSEAIRLHRCWWRMLETKCISDNFEMLVTELSEWQSHQVIPPPMVGYHW